MSWQGIERHDEIVEYFRRALERGRLASTFLFAGPGGVGKRTFAEKLAQSLLCQTRDEAALDPCGHCDGCQQVLAGSHPDLLRVGLPPGKNSIPIKLMIGADETRMREGLCYDISLKPFMGGRRIAIIDDADFLNTADVANCLLKTLEEPPPRSVLILIGTSPTKQLPTIRSRSQIVRFQPLPTATVADLLVSKKLIDNPADAVRLAGYSEGSLQHALELNDPELWAFRNELLAALAQPNFDSVQLTKALIAVVDAAGKDAPLRRARCRQLVGFAIEFYRQLARSLTGAAGSDDNELRAVVERARRVWPGDEERIVACLDRCHETLGHVDRYANQNTLLECWVEELAAIAAGRLEVTAY